MESEITLTNFTRILDEYRERFKYIVKRNLAENDNIASGDLFASINTHIEINGNVYKVILDSREYLKYLESGTRPHWPPVKAMLQWVRNKRLPTRENNPGDKSLPTEKQLAYLVGRKISQVGTKARNNIYNTQQELNDAYIPKLEEALVQDVLAVIPLIRVEIRS